MTFGKHPAAHPLDGEMIFRLWLETGSLSRTVKALTARGEFNPTTKRPYTKPGLALCAWRWAIKNVEDSYNLVKVVRAASGEFTTREEWMEEILAHAKSELSYASHARFLRGEYGKK